MPQDGSKDTTLLDKEKKEMRAQQKTRRQGTPRPRHLPLTLGRREENSKDWRITLGELTNE